MAKFVYVCLFIVLTYLGNNGGVAVITPPGTGEGLPDNTTPLLEGDIIGANVTNMTTTEAGNITSATSMVPITNETTASMEPITNETTTSMEPITNETTSPISTSMVPITNSTDEPSNVTTPDTNTTSTSTSTVTTPMSTTPSPSKAPESSHFNVGSFFGGIFLGIVVTLACFLLLRWYINRRKANPYRTV